MIFRFTSFLSAEEAPLSAPRPTSERDRFFNLLWNPFFPSLKKVMSHTTSYLWWNVAWYTWSVQQGWRTPTKNTTSRLIRTPTCWSIHFETFQTTSYHDGVSSTSTHVTLNLFLWIQLLYLAGYPLHLTYNLSFCRFKTFSTLEYEDSSNCTFCKSQA